MRHLRFPSDLCPKTGVGPWNVIVLSATSPAAVSGLTASAGSSCLGLLRLHASKARAPGVSIPL